MGRLLQGLGARSPRRPAQINVVDNEVGCTNFQSAVGLFMNDPREDLDLQPERRFVFTLVVQAS